MGEHSKDPKIAEIQKNLDETKDQMNTNIQNITKNMDNLEVLQDKTGKNNYNEK